MNPPITGEVGARVRIYLWGPSDDPGALCNGGSVWGSLHPLELEHDIDDAHGADA